MGADLSKFVERPESPQVSGEGVTKETVRIYQVNNSLDWISCLPARAESGADGYFARYSSRHGPGYTIVSLYWASSLSDPGSISMSRANDTIESDLSIDIVEKKLEDHADWLPCWNYDLWGYSTTGEAPAAPGWFATAEDFSYADGVSYYWATTKPADGKDGKWHKVGDKLKPGVEGYVIPQPVVTARKYCKTKATAVAYLRTSIGLAAPPTGYGWGETASNWLAFPVGISNDGEFWVAANEYRYAVSWDSDLYGST